MNILVTGGTGLIGSQLVAKLADDHHAVTIVTRDVSAAKHKLGNQYRFLQGLDSLNDLNEFDAIVNLAGEPIVDKRWSEARKQELQNSRWVITAQLSELCHNSDNPPEVFISGSAIGYYGRQGSEQIDETFQNVNPEFSQTLCQRWEELALGASSDKTRVCLLRTGIVLSAKGGALSKMLLPFKMGLGGPIGDGSHFMSWIHINDMVNGIMFLLQQQSCRGAFNLTAPNPVTNKKFSQSLASAVNRPCILFTPKVALKLAMGEMADLLIYGQNVVPTNLLEAGFEFHYVDIDSALESLNL